MRVKELRITYHARPDAPPLDTRSMMDPRSAAAFLIPVLEHQAQEVSIVLLLNAKHRVIAMHELGRGSLVSVEMSPRMIIRAALMTDAVSIIIAHNHPSGDPQPSADDIAVTRKIQAAARLFDIELLDHLIIGDQRYHSLKEHGVI